MDKQAILWSDDDFVVAQKPIGVDVEGEWSQPYWVVHRLDKPVSGVILLAKSPRAAEAGRALFAGREVEKVYWAITVAPLTFDRGELRHWLSHQHQGNRTVASNEAGPGRQEAWLTYQRLVSGDRYFLYQIILGTGRTHQIRAQLAAMGTPVKGDLKYGAPRSNKGGGISLLARSLRFTHPFTGEPLSFEVPPPENDALWTALTGLLPRPGSV